MDIGHAEGAEVQRDQHFMLEHARDLHIDGSILFGDALSAALVADEEPRATGAFAGGADIEQGNANRQTPTSAGLVGGEKHVEIEGMDGVGLGDVAMSEALEVGADELFVGRRIVGDGR